MQESDVLLVCVSQEFIGEGGEKKAKQDISIFQTNISKSEK